MKIKKILTSALIAIMLFTSAASIIPTRASAAHSGSSDSVKLTSDAVASIVNDYIKPDASKSELKFTSNRDMFEYDMSKGYLVGSTNGKYSIYVNCYTGVMYYINNLTGEILTSNPYSVGSATDGYKYTMASQIELSYSKVSGEEGGTMYSSQEAALRGQITVTRIDGGLRVNYALGETAVRYLMPIQIEAHEFEQDIITPCMDAYYDQAVLCLGEGEVLHYFDSDYYDAEEIYSSMFLHRLSISYYFSYVEGLISNQTAKNNLNGVKDEEYEDNCDILYDMKLDINSLLAAYNPRNPNSPETVEENKKQWESTSPLTAKGYAVYVVSSTSNAFLSLRAEYLKKYCPNYTFDMMFEDEAMCEYVHSSKSNPVFRCSLEYTFNEDGSLCVRLPSNSISFDETKYILNSIIPLKYFGAGDFSNDGYFFIPDGSGSVIEFEDFRAGNISFVSSLSFYGKDYCYSEVSGAHQQHLTMPVYGIKSQISDGEGGLQNTGYFAIIEEGSSMANINITYSQNVKNVGAIYTTMSPYPQDKYSYGDENSTYMLVSESKYTGSYVTRYVMLSDSSDYDGVTYSPGYIGMAQYYRNYLEKTGVIEELDEITADIPLYIEALGSMDVMEKFLTFPVTVSKAITTFDDIQTMYEELGDAKAKIAAKADEYQKLADDEEENESLKERYQQKADQYRELEQKVQNITNINFKLTGFSNGGMYFTYPTKVKWERSVGGKSGFKDLLEVAASYEEQGQTFGIYPDFDFQYINETSLFDGISKNKSASRLVDNRYASKQKYSSITGEYDSIYALIVSADSLDGLYDKFIKKYSKYDVDGISVSTLGSDLNSNLDEDNPVSRDEAQGYVSSLLDRIANESNYSVMISTGNIYAVKYADHILDIATDSTYYRYSSYTVPFVGMILHGYVSYSGSALNYSGSPDYDILRSIESGAAPYYVLGYRNTDLMKEDEELNSYYSVDYNNWYESIVESYAILNEAIGDLQNYKITDHRVLIGEQIISEEEQAFHIRSLKDEFISQLSSQLQTAIDTARKDIREGRLDAKHVGILADVEYMMSLAQEQLELSDDELETVLGDSFRAEIQAIYTAYEIDNHSVITDMSDAEADTHYVSIDVAYESKYNYVTGSLATDGKNYDYTDYTVDNDLIVMVTYSNNDGDSRTFILNYNIYDVEVTLDSGTYILGKYAFEVID